MTLEGAIAHFATLTPDKAAVITATEKLTYASLYHRICERAKQLQADGLCAGQPYAFTTTQDADFIVTYCAVHLCGAVSVPLESSTTKKHQQQILDGLNGQDTLTSFNRNEMVNGQRSTVNGQWSMVNGQWSTVNGQRSTVNISDVLFTTGTTGSAKGVMISEEAWTANAENLTDRLGFTAELLFIVCGPLNHLGSLSKIYPTLTNGATLYIMSNLKDLGAFFSVFDLPFARFATFLVPSSIRMLLQFARSELSAVARKIDFIETGAAPISQSDMEQLCQTLPYSRLFNTYASTETGIVCSYEFSRYGCVPGLVGPPMKHSTVRIAEDGRVVCSGSTIMSGYVGSPQASAQVLREGEVYTSDFGILSPDGMLHLQGRGDDIINAGGYKVNPIEVENAASACPLIQDCICVPAPHPFLGTAPKLFYVPRQDQTVKPRLIADFLKGRLESYKIPLFYEATEAIKRTYNGKLDRKAYKD